jgi:RNA binding exosome subunit
LILKLFSAAEVSVIIHATEDKDNILRPLNDILSIPEKSFLIRVAEGHWQNQILLMTSHLGKRQANELYQKIKMLDKAEDSAFTNLFDEKGNLYIRLDKQMLCKGKLVLLDRDSVRIKFKPVVKHKSHT